MPKTNIVRASNGFVYVFRGSCLCTEIGLDVYVFRYGCVAIQGRPRTITGRQGVHFQGLMCAGTVVGSASAEVYKNSATSWAA